MHRRCDGFNLQCTEHQKIRQPDLLLCVLVEGQRAEWQHFVLSSEDNTTHNQATCCICVLLRKLGARTYACHKLCVSKIWSRWPNGDLLSQGLIAISSVSVLERGAPAREKDSDAGASRGLPLSRDCNLVLSAWRREREGEKEGAASLYPAWAQARLEGKTMKKRKKWQKWHISLRIRCQSDKLLSALIPNSDVISFKPCHRVSCSKFFHFPGLFSVRERQVCVSQALSCNKPKWNSPLSDISKDQMHYIIQCTSFFFFIVVPQWAIIYKIFYSPSAVRCMIWLWT